MERTASVRTLAARAPVAGNAAVAGADQPAGAAGRTAGAASPQRAPGMARPVPPFTPCSAEVSDAGTRSTNGAGDRPSATMTIAESPSTPLAVEERPSHTVTVVEPPSQARTAPEPPPPLSTAQQRSARDAAPPSLLAAIPAPATSARRTVWRGDTATGGDRSVATETAIALTYGRTTHAVMMATPADLEDFAVGFSLSEGIIAAPEEIVALEIVAVPDGIECRMDLRTHRQDALARRQRRLAGPSGCGLCGLDSLAAAIRPVPDVPAGRRFSPDMLRAAMQAMHAAQALNAATRATHAAGFWTPEQGLVAVREDVGRHNALDKLAGALARGTIAAAGGMVLLSSRVSVEMVQKAAIAGAPVLIAISAPTSLAIRIAQDAGITLVGIARPDGCEVFTHPHRITPQAHCHAG